MIDRKKYDSFITNGDYTGLANYLSKFHFTDENQQKALTNAIKDFRSKGRMIQGMMSRADNEQRQAIAFINGLKNGELPGLNNKDESLNNRYSQDFAKAKRGFGSNGNNIAESVKINFGGVVDKRYGAFGLDFLSKDVKYDNDAFTDMLRITGLNKALLEKSGAKIENNNGTYSLTISKRNKLFDSVYNALTQLHSADNKRVYRFNYSGIDAKGNIIKHPRNIDSLAGTIDPTNNLVADKTGSLFSMQNSQLRARLKADEIIKPKFKSDSDITASSTVANFSCAREIDIRNALASGRLNTELANALLKETEDAINNSLINSSFTQYELWANDINDDDKETRHRIDDTEQRAKLQQLVINAIADKKLSVASCIQGNQTGTLLTIGPKLDKDEETGNDVEDIKQHRVQIFIPGFLNDEAEKVFNKRSDTRAIKELANMEMYGYDVDIPTSGKLKVYNDYNTGNSIYQMVQPDGSFTQISKDDALREMNKLIIAEDGIDLANQQFYNEDGKFRYNILNFNDGSINSDFNKELFNQIQSYSMAAMKELYPNSWKSFESLASDYVSGNTDTDEYKAKLAAASQSFIDRNNIGFIKGRQYLLSNYILNSIGYFDNYNIN